MKLHELLAEDMIQFDLAADDREGVLREMAGFLMPNRTPDRREDEATNG